MSFWELLALVGAMATIMGVFLAIYATLNNRVLKEESAHTREILLRMDQGQQNIQKDMAEARQDMAEARHEMAEARHEMAEARHEMAEAIKYLADLIRLDGERTRQAVRAPS